MTRTGPTTARPAVGHLGGLDGLRGVAVLAVLVAHLGEFVAPRQVDRLLPGGFLGVDVFFVLSGFLITGVLVDGAGSPAGLRAGRFWRRRVVRLLPSLVVLAIGYLVVATWAFDDPTGRTVRTFAWSFGLVANWQLSFGVQPPLDLLHLWTLSVEAQFYLVAPLLVLVAARRRLSLPTVALAIGAGIAASAVVRALEWRWWGDPGLVYTRTEARADAILVGALVAVAWRAWPAVVARLGRAAPLGAIGLVACAVLAHPGDPWLFRGGFTLVAGLAALVVAATVAAPGRIDSVLASAPLRLVGRMSYSLYLWHLPVFFWTLRWSDEADPWFGRLGRGDAGRIALALALTAAAATASYLAVERPFLRRRG